MTINSLNKNLVSNKMTEIEFIRNYDDALNKEGEIYLACDLGYKGAKDFSVCSLKKLRPYLDDDHNLYEILKENRPRYVHLDYDVKYNKIRDIYESKNYDDDQIKKDITDTIHGMMEDFLSTYGFDEDVACHILDSSDKVKFSFHFKFDLVLQNYTDCEVFHKKYLEYCNSTYDDDPDYNNIHKYIDYTIYTKNRFIRLPNQSKHGQDRPLKIYSGSKMVEDHILTYIKKGHKPITIPPPWIKRHTNKMRKINEIPTKTIEQYNEDDDLLWLIENTRHKGVNYDDWIKWVWACIASGIPYEIIHKESYRACPEKYDVDSLNNIIKRYQEGKGLGKQSLIKWASEKGRYLSREVEKKAKKLSENKEDHITWIDLQKKYHEKVFNSFEEMLEKVRDDVTQVISYIQGAQSVFTMYSNDENPFDLTKTLPYLIFKYKEIQDIVSNGATLQNEVTKQISLNKLLITNPLKFPLYNKLVFKPMDYGLKKNEKNTWIGFKAEKKDTYNMKPVNVFRKHIKEVLANNNEYSYRYIEEVVRTIFKTPWKKTGIFMLFYGEQGTGKTIVSEFLIKYVFGKHLSFSTTGIKPLIQRFNGCTMSKLFCCCNELSTINESGNNWHSGFDSMKSLITDSLYSYEKKGLEHIVMENYINFFGTTNNPNCIKVEKGDRRYACFEVSNKYKGDKKYFDNFVDVCMNDEAGNDIYNYYINTEDDDIDLRDIPETQLRKDLISNSKGPVERFIDDLLDGEHNVMDEKRWLDKNKITISNLYQEYCLWCGFNNEKCFSSNVFSRYIPKNKIKEKGNTRIDNKMKRWILFK